MDKDRAAGSTKKTKGSVKEAIGKVTGDSKTQAEGTAEKTAGQAQNAVGRQDRVLSGFGQLHPRRLVGCHLDGIGHGVGIALHLAGRGGERVQRRFARRRRHVERGELFAASRLSSVVSSSA